MPTIKQRLADILLKEDRQRLSAASSALLDVYQRWPALVRQSMTQSETERLGELDSRLVDLLARQQQTGQYQGYELTEADRLGAVYASRRAYDNDVLMEAVIDSWSSFGFGTSVDVVPRDPEAKLVWDAFWHAPQNGYLLNQKRVQDMSTYLLRDGDYLLVFYISTLDGSCIVRRVDTTEIQGGPEGTGVICLPQDREVPVLYRRQATGQDSTQAQYIRDWRATDAMVAQVREAEGWSFDDGVFLDEVKPTTRVVALHVAHKVRQLRGWPLMTTGLPWSAAYKNFLQDRAAIARAAAMYFEKVKVKGGQRVIDSLTAAMQSSLVHNTSAYETNPIPAAGSRWIENEQAELSRLPMSTGSGDAQVDGAMLKAQAALAGRMPSHWLGSGQDVQWATAQEMRLPILRALNGYGLFWSATWAEMAEIVLTAAEKYSPAAPKYSTYDVDVNTDAMNTIEIDQVIALMAELDSAVGAGWSAADYARVYPYLIRTALQTIGIKNTDDILPVSAAAAPVVADGAAVAVVPPAAVPAQLVAAGEAVPVVADEPDDKFIWEPGNLVPDGDADQDEMQEGGPGSGPQGGKGGHTSLPDDDYPGGSGGQGASGTGGYEDSGDGGEAPAGTTKAKKFKYAYLSVEGASPLNYSQQETFEKAGVDWASNLPDKQRDAVKRYQYPDYRNINGQLREKTGDDQTQTIKEIDKAMASSPPIEESIVVYRSMSNKLLGGNDPSKKVGKRVQDMGYASTSTNMEFAKQWHENDTRILAVIRVPKGQRGIRMNSLRTGTMEGEHEFLLPRGTRFNVKSVTVDTNGRTIMQMDVSKFTLDYGQSEVTSGEAFMEARPFGPEAYQRGLTRAARGLWSGALDANAFYAMASNAVAVGLTDAWHAGAAKCGVLPADLSPEELAALAGVIAAEYGYISNLLDYVDANSKANGGKLAALEPRLHMWAMRWGETHDKAQAMACKDKKLMWTMGDAEHSPDCLKLHGKVKRGSEWTASGILPRSDKLDCSLGCQCSLMPTDKPISRGPLPTLAGQMGESNTAAEGGPGSGPSQIR